MRRLRDLSLFIISLVLVSNYLLIIPTQITLQFIVITWAIFFIFLGVPLLFCALTVPICIFCLFVGTYFSFYAKAVELMRVIRAILSLR